MYIYICNIYTYINTYMAWIFIQEITELNELFHKQLCIISQKGAFTKESFLERLEKNAKSFESYT